MADDTPDLISNISITGGDDAVATLQNVGDQGAAALDKLAASAQKSADAVGSASDQITKSLSGVQNAVPDSSAADRLASIEAAARSLGSAVRTGVGDVTSFGVKIAGVGVAALGAITGLAKFAQSITAATRAPTDLTAELTKQQEKLNRQVASNASQAVEYDNSIQGLNRDLAAGKLNYVTYGQAVTDLNQKFKDQERAHEALQEAQRVTLEQNQKLQIQAEQTEAFNHLVKIYGTDLTNSLITLGKQSLSVQKSLRDAFGPILSTLVDKIINLIDQAMPQINTLINTAAKSLNELVTTSGPSIQQVTVFLIDMGKSAVQVVQTVIVPAFKGFLAILQTVADFINHTFGTNISGNFLLILAVVLQMTGGFTALFAVINIGVQVFSVLQLFMSGPLIIAVVLITAALVALAVSVDWKALGASIQAAFNTLKTAGIDAINSVLSFFTSFPGNLAIVWAAVVAGAQALWQQLVDGFNSLVQMAVDVGNAIGAAFQAGWDKITSGATNMWNTVKGFFGDLIDKAKTLLGLQGQVSDGAQGGDSSNTVSAAGGGLIRGAGSETSDSIPAWLSNNEFVVRAKAVAKYGVGFMKAINNGALDLSGVIPGFANGGLVTTMPIQRFASGGSVAKSNRVLNLTIGGETFQGLQMPEAVADRMTKFAVAKQVSSAGRKPAWVGGQQ